MLHLFAKVSSLKFWVRCLLLWEWFINLVSKLEILLGPLHFHLAGQYISGLFVDLSHLDYCIRPWYNCTSSVFMSLPQNMCGLKLTWTLTYLTWAYLPNAVLGQSVCKEELTFAVIHNWCILSFQHWSLCECTPGTTRFKKILFSVIIRLSNRPLIY